MTEKRPFSGAHATYGKFGLSISCTADKLPYVPRVECNIPRNTAGRLTIEIAFN